MTKKPECATDYVSEYENVPYSVVSRRQDGTKIFTSVLMYGGILEFEADMRTIQECKDLVHVQEASDG